MSSPEFFVVDTNVLLVAALAEHAEHPARQAAIGWLERLGSTADASLIVDVRSPPGHSAAHVLRPQFLPSISVANPESRILFEYRQNLAPTNRFMKIVAQKVELGQGVVVHVDYDGPYARLDGVQSTIDPSDRKFVAAAVNFIRHHVMGQRFRPKIVYADDVADWQACRDELERDYGIGFIRLGSANAG